MQFWGGILVPAYFPRNSIDPKCSAGPRESSRSESFSRRAQMKFGGFLEFSQLECVGRVGGREGSH